jgi:hypothetical protein
LWGTIHVDGDAQLTAPALAVTRADGSDAAVTLSPQDSDFAIVSEDGARRTLTLGKNASYSAFGLKPGRCTLQLTSRGIVPFDEALDLPFDQEKVRHDITVKRAISLPVKFVARATGAVMTSMSDCALSVVLTRDQPARIAGVLGHSAPSGALGRYREQAMFPRDVSIPAGCAGVIELYTSPVMAHCALHDEVIASRTLRGNETELVFELEPSEIASKLGSLTIRCVNAANGAAVEGARVMLSFQDGGGGGGKTDQNGLAHCEKLAPGMREIQMMVPKFANFSRWVRIPAGEELDVGTIELSPAARVAGRIVDSNGRGIGAELIAIPVRAFASPHAADGRTSFSAAANGSFSSVFIERGPVRLVASNPDSAITALDVDASGGSVEGLEMRMEKGTQITFRAPVGTSDRVDFAIADASGRPLVMKSAFPTFSPRVRLRPGTYELRYVVDDDVVRKESLDVGTEPIAHEVRAP